MLLYVINITAVYICLMGFINIHYPK